MLRLARRQAGFERHSCWAKELGVCLVDEEPLEFVNRERGGVVANVLDGSLVTPSSQTNKEVFGQRDSRFHCKVLLKTCS